MWGTYSPWKQPSRERPRLCLVLLSGAMFIFSLYFPMLTLADTYMHSFVVSKKRHKN